MSASRREFLQQGSLASVSVLATGLFPKRLEARVPGGKGK